MRPKEYIGKRVKVLWSLDQAEGTVIDVTGPRGRPFAIIAVELPGASEGEPEVHTVSIPLEGVELVESTAAAS